MEIRDANIVDTLDRSLNVFGQLGGRNDVEQRLRRVPAKAHPPLEDHESTDDPHRGIEERPARIATRDEGRYRQHAREGICEDVKVGCAQVVVMAVAVRVRTVVIVGVTVIGGVVMAVMFVRRGAAR